MTNNIDRPMSHADTLRTWAGQYITPAAREPFLAGADALDTLRQVREALDRVNQECGRYPAPAPGQRHSPCNAGYLDGLDTARTWITEALEGDNE